MLIGIARRSDRYVPMETIASGLITTEAGLKGDHKGSKFAKRQITIMAIEDWHAALVDLALTSELSLDLPWTVRRANLLTQGLRLPRARGAILRVGDVELKVEAQLLPCGRMDQAYNGLRKALHPNWRGGLACSVSNGGVISLQDEVIVLHHPPERTRRLP